jgi:hypothetical protein
MLFNVIVLVLGDDKTVFAILGPNNNYIEITVSKIDEILSKQYKRNLNEYFLFQIDVKNEVKSLRKSSKSPVVTEGSPFENFIQNIPLIWQNTPQPIKVKYKLLSEKFEESTKPTELVIKSFDPENLVRKSRKRGLKENRAQHRKKRYKDTEDTLKSKDEAEKEGTLKSKDEAEKKDTLKSKDEMKKEDNKNEAFTEPNNIPAIPVIVGPSFPQTENTAPIGYLQPYNTILETSGYMNLSFDLSDNFFSVSEEQPEEFSYPLDLYYEYITDTQDSFTFGSS